MDHKPGEPFKSAMDEADAIDARVAAMRVKLQITAISDGPERRRLVYMISDAQKMALRLRVGSE